MGRSGGLITCWDERKFACSSTWSLGNAAIVNGRWKTTMEEVSIINVYTPCNRVEKRLLWDIISLLVAQSRGSLLCLIGDFNSILEEDKRKGAGGSGCSGERREFKDFIEGVGLIDGVSTGKTVYVL